MISRIFFTILLVSNIALGDQAQYLPKGTSTPFEGYLITVPEAQDLRKKVIEGASYQVQAESLQRSLDAQKQLTDSSEQKVKLYSDEADKLSKSLADARSTSDFTKFLYFATGIIATIGAGIALGKVAR